MEASAGVGGAAAVDGVSSVSKREYFLDLFWRHKHTTITLCFVFWSFGMCVAFLGPTLLDLGCKTQTVFSTMSWVFFSQSLFILLGAAAGGVLVERLTPNLTLVLGTAMMTMTMALIPVCHVLAVLAVVLAIMGFFMGCIDTVANVYMIRIYSKDVSPFLQALHFFYGIGAFVSPMIAQPFLLNEDCSVFIDNSSDSMLDQEDMNPSGGGLPATSLAEAQRKTHIDYAFWIMALLMVPVVLLALSLVGKQWYRRRLASQDPGTKQAWYESVDDPSVPAIPDKTGKATGTSQIILVALLTAAMMFLYDGLQAAYGGYIYSYAVKGAARLPRADAAYLNALFWGMFAMGRLISIALATKLAPALMLLCNVCGCTLGVTLMLCVPWSKAVLIMGTMLMGIFMSSVFPTALSLAEQCIYVSPRTTSTLVFGAALGEMSMPVILGHEFHRIGPTAFPITCMALCVLSCVVYVGLWAVGHQLTGGRGLITAWLFGAKPECGEDSGLMTQHVRYYSRMRSDLSDNSVDEHESTLTSGPEPPATQQAPPAVATSPVAPSGGTLNPFQQ
ncbi:major facilitator superfamily domain-containing protein 4A-like [Dermacentor andersoni]|uniref:major facilitator superfamily domain-containing protein 4A-like n=1 Tax=Dermacentor andersoni TaxID=34620 RepID=UPI00215504B6|nr:major facilitator superfamily domain-containing protein 4A-like [Dermacentor andersoni]